MQTPRNPKTVDIQNFIHANTLDNVKDEHRDITWRLPQPTELRTGGNISTVDNESFRYSSSDKWILEDVSPIEGLAVALDGNKGAIVLVSHDVYFIDLLKMLEVYKDSKGRLTPLENMEASTTSFKE